MVHPLFIEDAWCYWVISAGALFSFVGLIVACICSCRRNDNKSNTANRSLPDIPKDKNADCETDVELRDVIYEVTENIGGDPSELYATVRDKNEDRKDKRDKQSISQQSSQDETASLYARLQTPQTSSEEHPYAQVQNVPKTENAQHIRNNSSHMIDLAQPSTSTGGNLPVAPPRSRRSSSHNSLLEQPVPDIQAATAITGGVQANQDLPYMTPPILMPLPQPPQPQNNSPQQQHFSGDSQDSKGYTSISVREPLANIIAQTKSAQQQRQATRPITDPHYATVSDDSDEMYAAIDEQDKVYTSGSETYAQIQPMAVEVNRPPQNEQPNVLLQSSVRAEEPYALAPQPPSVDSLRHVAHAHSRQASSSSATSSVANPSSPKPEKRQANSPLPPPPENPMDMYAMIDKRNKSDDRTRASVSSGKSLEDMYAKVMKKKRESVDDDLTASPTSGLPVGFSLETSAAAAVISSGSGARRKLSLIEVSRASWSSHDSVEILKREPDTVVASVEHNNGVEPFDDEFDLDHGYEAVAGGGGKRLSAPSVDANYETLRPLNSASSSSRNGIDTQLPIYSMPFKHRQVSNASSEDPGYEKVRLCKRPTSATSNIGLEDVDTDSEPNYESMPHDPIEPNYASVGACRLGTSDSDADPNYESVSNGDPNYESVKYVSTGSAAAVAGTSMEPPYERLAAPYDPDYERIRRSGESHGAGANDTDDEQYVQV
ncbi:uncharacterized protein LOC100118022 isoform X3 [Nasonia vitripennis]|uniref:Uncharacterized protein n=1 Tax=Nasonia vitripennis TaxID=7425 RepID=A0A7M7QTB3_NASVI|nr:uncharacterized protein LOC100118022 isoform X3 [Nasonia vitripennis]XP_032454367.1 uncharacterized protein LOC100118022 isoform X3 [Nasonia vitripennis]